MNGLIFDIQRFSLHDGPGIRTTVFFKGCPLECKWCHNPEGLDFSPSLSYIDEKCIGCGKCAGVCPNNVHIFENSRHTVRFESCNLCGKCANVCPAQAVSIFGYEISIEKLAAEIARDKEFYGRCDGGESGGSSTENNGEDIGGVTFSGGEVMLQYKFAAEAAKYIKNSGSAPTVAIDTSGFASREAFEAVIPYTDIFLYDIKAYSDSIHFSSTGVHNSVILDNLKFLSSFGKRIWVRIPLISGINCDESEMKKISRFLSSLDVPPERVTVMPYHLLGKNKYAQIGKKYVYNGAPPDRAAVDKMIAILESDGLNIRN